MIKTLSISLLVLFCYVLNGQTKIELALQSFEKDTDLKFASIGFCAIDINSNKIYAQRSPTKALVPASSMKVITTGSALALLGSDYKFKTFLEYSGSISNGTLNGNLYIRGTGDPSLASPIMEGILTKEMLMAEFVAAIKKAGIQKINGAIVGDGSYFDDQVMIPTWQWGDIGNHYGAGTSGLNYHDNLYYIHFKKHKDYGATPTIDHTVPDIPQLKFDNRVTSAGSKSGDNAYVYAAPYGTEVTLRGTIPKGSGLFNIKGATPDPALLCAHDLQKSLALSGVTVSKKATTQRLLKKQEPRTKIHTHYSPSLAAICKHTNEDSRNMYCEALLKTIGAKIKGQGSTNNGIAAIADFWRGRGINMEGFFMKDGCGLSARNGVSPKTFAEIMRKMYIDKKTFGDFYNQMAIAGRSGTLRNMCRNSSAENNVRAKSGSMNRIRSYTGFVTTKGGKKLAFSMIVNNYSCSGYMMKKKLETLMIALAESH
ncbi:D-alanyl-D-alanine carboxypeptidase/D-alanyl-D-alanine endopeptidase [Aureispira anguillae]|uniref:D-alanyl-D-alanine carboxypeptidase/D-alanyl-D-alanine-endopeptidase n=1 Tax=Aureispira anguillae TaxID=2864201 RepID=A0A915YGX6_9BACT|nr:D-alanyl-D-alanine carboxypeptidase/D-alanyl-D-alanine-endopeptidase [Aureispira anguillae]BDS12962.1 D-alanyl-D-alanine carboxypeptidase/D-alanyl-D-alanine-endopeptidase [Aureispira anguillae]